MKKFFTLIVAALLTCTLSAQSLFSTQFKTADEFAAWKVVDANNDGSTWKFDDWGSPSYVYYTYSGQNDGNDWLISPEIVPTKTGTVAVLFTFQGSSYSEAMEVYVGKDTVLANFVTPSATFPEVKDNMHSSYVLVDATEGQAFHVAFRATTPKDRFRLFLCSVEAKHVDNAFDLGVTEITSPVTGKNLGQESVTIKVKNFASSDVTDFSVSYKIDDKDAVVENITGTIKAGEELEYTFATKADLSTPRANYTIKAFANLADDLNSSNDTCTIKVRHVAPAAAPYFLGFEDDEDVSGLLFYNLNDDSGEWEINVGGWWNLARTGNNCLGYNYDSNNAGNDWAILEPILVEPGYYALKFWYSATENHPEKLSVHYGKGSTPEAMTTKVLELNPITNATYQEAIIILNFTEAQSVNFGFYSFSPKNENWILIDDISFDKVNTESTDLAATQFSAPFDFVRPGNGTDVVFDARNLGIKDLTAEVKLTIDAGSATTQSVAVKGQEIKTITFANALADLALGKHTLQVVVKAEGDENAANDTIAKEIVVLGKATKFWDFEDGKVPEDFTFEVGDEGTVNPDAGEEFNEYGWGLFPVSEHPMLGTKVLAGTSWIDGVDKANRTVILPAVDITSEESYFVWDANSYNPSFLERYSVDIQDNTSSWPYFSSKYSSAAESVVPKTHGFSLADYVGKNIFIAFNITTANGEALILDNLGIYDGIAGGPNTSVEDLLTNAIIISNDEVHSAGAQLIVLTDVLGRTLKTVEGDTLDLIGLPTGVYVATVKTATATTSCKFIKR